MNVFKVPQLSSVREKKVPVRHQFHYLDQPPNRTQSGLWEVGVTSKIGAGSWQGGEVIPEAE